MKKFSPPQMKEVSFPTPYTLHPTPHTPHPTPYTLFQVRSQETVGRRQLYSPHTPHPTPHTLHPTS
ncbi:MAG: hypothetical protein GPJ13_00895 [Microcystis aeruginosa W11-06]|nr:hypothetical protein [Microcystis aeruginosa W11-03]NCR92379.1 hypothetical protein [Microcystis aeruginosa W11-06]